MIQKRIGKRGTTYGVRVYRKGAWRWVGTFPTRQQAREAQAKAMVALVPQRMRCEQLVDAFLADYEHRAKDSSYNTARHALTGFLADFRTASLDISPLEAEKWARENPWRVPVVVSMFKYAVKRELIARSPFAGLSPEKGSRRDLPPLTEEEVEALAQAAYKAHGRYGSTLAAFIRFAAYSALRPGEIFALEWPDVDFDSKRIWVTKRRYQGRLDKPKSGKPERVLFPQARDALLSLGPQSEGVIFTSKRGKRLSQSTLSSYWSALSVAFGRHVDPYELRHFGGHYLYVTKNLPARVVAVQLGHKGPRMVEDLYGHGDVGALEELERASNVVSLRDASETREARDG